VAVWHLQRALAKKRDPLSHVAFADALAAAGAPPPLARFWCAAPARAAAAAMTASGAAHLLCLRQVRCSAVFCALTSACRPA